MALWGSILFLVIPLTRGFSEPHFRKVDWNAATEAQEWNKNVSFELLP